MALKDGNWLMRVVGEPPSIYDSTLSAKTKKQFELYMFSRGFLQSKVEETLIQRKSKVKVTYNFLPGTPYKIGKTKNFVNRKDFKRIVS